MMMNHYDSYGTSIYSDEPLWDECESDGNASLLSEQEHDDLEVALYSQLHFEHCPQLDLTDHNISGVTLEEEDVGPEPDQSEIHWRERLLEGVCQKDSTLKAGDTSVTKVPRSAPKDANEELVRTKQPQSHQTKNVKSKQPDIRNKTNGENFTKKKIEDKKRKENTDIIGKDEIVKESIQYEKSDLSKMLFRKEAENQFSHLELKRPKVLKKVTSMVVMCIDSDDSDTGETACKKRKQIEIQLGETDNPIVIGDSPEPCPVKLNSKIPANNTAVKSKIKYDEDSSDDSIIEIKLAKSHSPSDIQTNIVSKPVIARHSQAPHASKPVIARHPREPPVKKTPTKVPLDSLTLEDYQDLSIEDIHLSMGECDWELVSADRYSGATSTVSRYFKKLDVTCHNCKEKGHLSKICPKPKKLSVCLHCGIEGHMLRTCNNPVCFNCLQMGHRREACMEPRRHPNAWCERCELQGHTTWECSDLWRQYHMTTKEGGANIVRMVVNKRVFCYNCAMEGHFGHQCKSNRMDRYQMPQLPFIAHYSRVQSHSANQPPYVNQLPYINQLPYVNQPPREQFPCTIQERPRERKSRRSIERRADRVAEKKKNPQSNKRKTQTQNERFEAEYQGMVNQINRNQNERQVRKKNKQYPTSASLEAHHSGDFVRNAKAARKRRVNEQLADPRFNQMKGKKRKRKAESEYDHSVTRVKRTRHENLQQRKTAKSGKSGKRANRDLKKKMFVSDRGFHCYI